MDIVWIGGVVAVFALLIGLVRVCAGLKEAR
jgi:hypothetical protein